MNINKIQTALVLATATFRLYEKIHKAKGTKDAEEKAITNAQLADAMQQATLDLQEYEKIILAAKEVVRRWDAEKGLLSLKSAIDVLKKELEAIK